MPQGRPGKLTLANWDLGGEPSQWAYLHAGDLFPHVDIAPGGPPAKLETGERREVREFEVSPGVTLDEYVAVGPVSGIVVVRGGEIVYERYPGMEPDDRHLLMSVSKVFPSVIAGILARRGQLDLGSAAGSVVTELSGGGWAGVPLNDVLNMRSGIWCPEVWPQAYTDPQHPFYQFEACLGWRPGGQASPYDVVAGLASGRPPGEAYEYTSVNTFVLSWVAEVLTGLPFAEVIRREIWSRGGFEAPAQLCLSAAGAPVSHGGLSMTLRDLARFGMLFTPSWRLVAEQPVVDSGHLRDIQTAGRPELHEDLADPPDYMISAYGRRLPPAARQWNFVTAEGDLFKGGFGGQGLYISPVRDLVIAFAGVPREDGEVNLLRWYSRRLAVVI